MKRLETDDGISLAYRTYGAGPRALVFVHGWMVSGRVWDALIEELALSDVQLVVPDLRGTGDSDAADEYTLRRYVDDIVCIADSIGLERFDLVGHSMGGQIAQLCAAEFPDRIDKMALLSPVPASGIELPDEVHELFYHSGGDREAQNTILEQATRDLDESLKASLLDASVDIPPACIRQSYTAWTGADFADRLADIDAETLVVVGDDPFLPADLLERTVVDTIVDARMVHVPGAGHYLHLERTAETARHLEAFFEPSSHPEGAR